MAEFFASNLIFVYLIYGFAFMVMGLVLSLLVRTPLRPPALGSLWLLAAFGLLHGSLEWTDLAVLVEQRAGATEVIGVLRWIALGLTGLSFAFLLQFGTEVLARLAPRLWPLRLLAPVLFVVWLLLSLVVGPSIAPIGSSLWITSGQVMARYLLGFSGCMFTSVALAWLGISWRRPRWSPVPYYLLIASVAFGAYGILAGLIVPAAPFFPASVLNADNFLAVTGLPVQLLRALMALVVGATLAETFIVEAARRQERTGRTLAVLNDNMREIVSEVSLDTTLRLVVERARDLLGTDTSFLALVSPDQQCLEMAASVGVRTEVVKRLRLNLEEGIAGAAMRTGRPVIVDNYLRAPGLLRPPLDVMRDEGVISGIGAPMMKDGRLLGVLYVFNRRPTRFDPADADTLASFAGEAAIAIDRARLLAEINEDRQQLAAALQREQELERQREEFVSVVAHDLRGPITVISGFAELLLRQSPEQHGGPREEKALANIAASAERLKRMVSDLLDASRLEARRLELKRQKVDLARLMQDVVERVAELTKGHEVEVVCCEGLPPVDADPERVEQILSNLLSNAAKYSYPETPILVRVTPEPPEHPREALVAVTNEGVGVPPEEIPRLFSRFHRAPSAGASGKPGLGLGLYITKGLVEAHGGRVWVESEPGKTTTFCFTLPVVETESRADCSNKLR
ncbi:MAG: GAF domain-containing protein [Chloroflexota bacterium]|nr:MAG: GAF domain-containing protein [Chloroflexota bacterium]